MVAGKRAQFTKCFFQFCRRLAGKELIRRDLMPLENFKRHIELIARGMDG